MKRVTIFKCIQTVIEKDQKIIVVKIEKKHRAELCSSKTRTIPGTCYHYFLPMQIGDIVFHRKA